MNDTKWNELRTAMLNDMPFPPPYILKFLFEDEVVVEERLYEDVSYLGDWNYVFAI